MAKKTGVLFIGSLGSVATTVMSGVHAVKKGLAPLRGVISDQPEFNGLHLVPIEDLVFGGWDLRQSSVLTMAREHGVVPEKLLNAVSEELENIPVWQAPAIGNDEYLRSIYFNPEKNEGSSLDSVTLNDAVSEIEKQIGQFRQKFDVDRVIVINTSSTEKKIEDSPCFKTLEAFEEALNNNSPVIRPGMVYAYAAIKSHSAFVNFTPSVTAEIPALKELANRKGVPIAGKDGRTGQTLYKHVIGRMFKLRGLKVTGWYSMNILGNEDGAVLEDPDYAETKIHSKTTGLEHILEYSDFDHRVRIDYFPIRGDKKEAWDTIDFEGWLGEQMSMKINWLGEDSILAAPLIVDLARFMDHALRVNLAGTMKHLSFLFKSPYDTSEFALDKQHQSLLEFVHSYSE